MTFNTHFCTLLLLTTPWKTTSFTFIPNYQQQSQRRHNYHHNHHFCTYNTCTHLFESILPSTDNGVDNGADTHTDTTPSNDSTSTYTAILHSKFNLNTEEDAQRTIDNVLYPDSEQCERLQLGYQATGIDNTEQISPNDDRLTFTYAEFPLNSFYQLVNRAKHWRQKLVLKLELKLDNDNDNDNDNDTKRTQTQTQTQLTMVDLGSGCGKLVLYAALALHGNMDENENENENNNDCLLWNIHGIEISQLLHDYGVQMMKRGIQENIFKSSSNDNGNDKQHHDSFSNVVSLHCGPASSYVSLLQDADIIFAYSSAFHSIGFFPDVGAMILGPEWSQMLAECCSDGCIVVTTDRALNPEYGWKLLDQLDVENRELVGSTGYIQVLDKTNFVSKANKGDDDDDDDDDGSSGVNIPMGSF